MKLEDIGWTEELALRWHSMAPESLSPARVVADFGTSLRVAFPDVRPAELSGKLAHYSNRQAVPKVGDWVGVRLLDNGPGVIEAVLPRKSELARKVAGRRTVKQVIAANVDVAFVLLALDGDFSVERLKRYLYQLSVSGIEPVIVLSKADKTDDIGAYVAQLTDLGCDIIVSAATDGTGADEIARHIHPGRTAILLGSSGVGKSTLTNRLLGRQIQETQPVRESDATGKHTTVHRELFVLPDGGLLIDTPGIRELQLWGTEEDLDDAFDDVAELIAQCKFSTCSHTSEPGCAIRRALDGGQLSAAHYADYRKLKGELVNLKKRNQVKLRDNNKKSHKNIRRQDDEGMREMRAELD